MTWLFVCLGAALGAPTRYLVDRALRRGDETAFPWGTLAVNVAGSAVLGALVGAAASRQLPAVLAAGLGTGFCGALTTYSAFAVDTAALSATGQRRRAALNVVANVVAGLAAASVGYALGTAF